MKSLLIATAAALAGCTVIPAGSVHQACRVIEIAVAEAEMSPSWYVRAGEVACLRPVNAPSNPPVRPSVAPATTARLGHEPDSLGDVVVVVGRAVIPALNTHLVAAAVTAVLAWQFQGARLGAELAEARLEATTQQLATSTAQRAADARVRSAEQAMHTKYQGALNAARDREALLRRDLDQLRTASDSLREQSADAARRLASAPPAAVLEYATALGVVFEDCRAAYGDMTGKAAGHATDVQTLGAAWHVMPRGPLK
jgi:hypothetical protein